jgi:hypothetical protein
MSTVAREPLTLKLACRVNGSPEIMAARFSRELTDGEFSFFEDTVASAADFIDVPLVTVFRFDPPAHPAIGMRFERAVTRKESDWLRRMCERTAPLMTD